MIRYPVVITAVEGNRVCFRRSDGKGTLKDPNTWGILVEPNENSHLLEVGLTATVEPQHSMSPRFSFELSDGRWLGKFTTDMRKPNSSS